MAREPIMPPRRRRIAPAPHPTPPAILQPPAFTARQREVIFQVALGLRNRQVAHVLGISERSVEAHLTRIYRRLPPPWRNRVGLADLAHRAGWLD
jgi:DNA-binding NarL/FixJ family response regulator